MASMDGHGPEDHLPVQVISVSHHCIPVATSWTATWISSSRQLHQMLLRCQAHLLGAKPSEMPFVDFGHFRVLAVEMGQKSTAGFGFESENVSAHVGDNAVILKLNWIKPSPQAVTAQILTSPCILIQLPLGTYDRIQVVDQYGSVLCRVQLH